MTKKRSLAEARKWVRTEYESQTDFARQHGFTVVGVHRVLTGISKCLYGEGLAIAKELNLDLDEVRK